MKKIIIALLLSLNLSADSVDLIEFESDVFSKNSKILKKISISLHLDGEDLEINSYKIQDALNIIISSFYLEDLLTSKGKERFKSSFSSYLLKKYRVKVSSVFILKLVQISDIPDVDKLIEALKLNGCCKKNSNIKKLFNENIE
jgi:hypothetical protein